MRMLFAVLCLATASLANAGPTVELKTSLGDIVIELDREKAPATVDNFVTYVKDGFYAGTIFHRVIDGFMIQGGGFDRSMKEKLSRAAIRNEAANGLKNVAGSIAMARTNEPHSASAQFFINLVDNAPLDYPGRDGWGYCVFGRVTKGMEVVRAIGKVPTAQLGYFADVPAKPVVIESVRLVNP